MRAPATATTAALISPFPSHRPRTTSLHRPRLHSDQTPDGLLAFNPPSAAFTAEEARLQLQVVLI